MATVTVRLFETVGKGFAIGWCLVYMDRLGSRNDAVWSSPMKRRSEHLVTTDAGGARARRSVRDIQK